MPVWPLRTPARPAHRSIRPVPTSVAGQGAMLLLSGHGLLVQGGGGRGAPAISLSWPCLGVSSPAPHELHTSTWLSFRQEGMGLSFRLGFPPPTKYPSKSFHVGFPPPPRFQTVEVRCLPPPSFRGGGGGGALFWLLGSPPPLAYARFPLHRTDGRPPEGPSRWAPVRITVRALSLS